MPKFDFTKADESTGFEALPKGDYKCEIESIDPDAETSDEAKKFPNAPMTKIVFSVLDEDHENRKLFLNLIFPKGKKEEAAKQRARSAGRVKQLCRASGAWSEEDLESEEFELDWDDLDGAKFTLKVVEQRKGDGNNIVAIKPYDDTDDVDDEDEEEIP